MSTPTIRRMARGPAAALAAVALLAAGCGSSSDSSSTSTGSSGSSSASTAPVKVDVLQIAPVKVLDDTVAAFEAQLRKDLAPRKVTFDLKNAQGDESLIQSIARDFRSSDADAISVIGTPAVIAMSKLETKRPIFAIAMGDPVGSKVAKTLDAPGGNVTGSIDFVDPARLLGVLARTTPAPKSIGTIYDPSNQNSAVWVAALDKATSASGVKVVKASVAGAKDVPTAARSLVGRADAILLGPDTAANTALAAVSAAAKGARIPLYLVAGDAKATGATATLGPDYPSIGRQTAQVAAKVLEGASPATTAFSRPESLAPDVNAAAARAAGVTFPEANAG